MGEEVKFNCIKSSLIKVVSAPVYMLRKGNALIGNVDISFYTNGHTISALKVNRFVASMIRKSSIIELCVNRKNDSDCFVLVGTGHGVQMSSEEFKNYKFYPIWDKNKFVEEVEVRNG